MNKEIEELADRLHILHKQIMETNPWEDGYGEIVAIHKYLMNVLRDETQKSYSEFRNALDDTLKKIDEEFKGETSIFGKWLKVLKPVLEQAEVIVGHAVPLLKLII